MSPTVAPLIGRNSPSVSMIVAGSQIAACTQVGGEYSRSTSTRPGMTICPTIRMVKYGGASSARASPSGAWQFEHTGVTRRNPWNRGVLPQAGHCPSAPRPSATPIGGTGQSASFGDRSGCQRTGMSEIGVSKIGIFKTGISAIGAFETGVSGMQLTSATLLILRAGGIKSDAVARILIVNPNSDQRCSAGIDAAIAPFRFPGGPAIEVATLTEGPPAIYTWQDWHAVVAPLCHFVQTSSADIVVIACASDPGIDAVRAATNKPVLGVFRCAVVAAVARAERFGVIALVDASKPRHLLALRALGLDHRLAAEFAMNVALSELLDPTAARAALIASGRRLVESGAETVILGCTGMAAHRAAIEQAIGVPVIEPCQAAAAQALLIAAGHGVTTGSG